MKANHNNSVAINNTNKTNKDIRNNSLFAEITAEEEVFVRGGFDYDETGPGIVHRKCF